MSGASKPFERAQLVAFAAVWVVPPESSPPDAEAGGEPPGQGQGQAQQAQGQEQGGADERGPSPSGPPTPEGSGTGGAGEGEAGETEPAAAAGEAESAAGDDAELDSWLAETMGGEPRVVRQLLSELWSFAHFNPDGLRRILMAVTRGDELTAEAFLRWLVDPADDDSDPGSDPREPASVIDFDRDRMHSIALSSDDDTRPYPSWPAAVEDDPGDDPGDDPAGNDPGDDIPHGRSADRLDAPEGDAGGSGDGDGKGDGDDPGE